MEKEPREPGVLWGHLSLIHQGSPLICVFPYGLTGGFSQCINLGLLRVQLPYLLVSFKTDIFNQAPNLVLGDLTLF